METTKFATTPAGRKVRIEADRRFDKPRYTVYLGKVLVGTWDSIDLPLDWEFFLVRIDVRCEKYRLS